jgi:hypothetical protein
MPDKVTADYVRAQWAYSELYSTEQGQKYSGSGIPELKTKLALGVPFDQLDQAEHELLLKAWFKVRGGPGSIFAAALSDVSAFQPTAWTKSDLGQVCIIGHFYQWLPPTSQSSTVTFEEWVETEPYGELSEYHPLREPTNARPFKQHYPVTIGPLQGATRLLDGYHRAVRFWRQEESAAALAVYVPLTGPQQT